MRTAFVDESASRENTDPGVYILSAVLVEASREDEVRTALARLRQRWQRKVHWHDTEGVKRRLLLIEQVRSFDLPSIAVVTRTHSDTPLERRRRLTMERLIVELQMLDVHRVALESRGAANDTRDRAHLDTARARRLVTAPLRIEHRAGPEEPLLWISDVVCGAIVQARNGDPRYLTGLGDCVTLVHP